MPSTRVTEAGVALQVKKLKVLLATMICVSMVLMVTSACFLLPAVMFITFSIGYIAVHKRNTRLMAFYSGASGTLCFMIFTGMVFLLFAGAAFREHNRYHHGHHDHHDHHGHHGQESQVSGAVADMMHHTGFDKMMPVQEFTHHKHGVEFEVDTVKPVGAPVKMMSTAILAGMAKASEALVRSGMPSMKLPQNFELTELVPAKEAREQARHHKFGGEGEDPEFPPIEEPRPHPSTFFVILFFVWAMLVFGIWIHTVRVSLKLIKQILTLNRRAAVTRSPIASVNFSKKQNMQRDFVVVQTTKGKTASIPAIYLPH